MKSGKKIPKVLRADLAMVAADILKKGISDSLWATLPMNDKIIKRLTTLLTANKENPEVINLFCQYLEDASLYPTQPPELCNLFDLVLLKRFASMCNNEVVTDWANKELIIATANNRPIAELMDLLNDLVKEGFEIGKHFNNAEGTSFDFSAIKNKDALKLIGEKIGGFKPPLSELTIPKKIMEKSTIDEPLPAPASPSSQPALTIWQRIYQFFVSAPISQRIYQFFVGAPQQNTDAVSDFSNPKGNHAKRYNNGHAALWEATKVSDQERVLELTTASMPLNTNKAKINVSVVPCKGDFPSSDRHRI